PHGHDAVEVGDRTGVRLPPHAVAPGLGERGVTDGTGLRHRLGVQRRPGPLFHPATSQVHRGLSDRSVGVRYTRILAVAPPPGYGTPGGQADERSSRTTWVTRFSWNARAQARWPMPATMVVSCSRGK